MTVPLRPTTPKRASDSERPLNPGGAGGIPPATLCVQAFSRESLDPPPGTGRGTTSQVWTCAGPNPAPLPGAARCCVPFGWVARKHPRGAVPRGARLPGGGPHFSREMGRKRARGLCYRQEVPFGPAQVSTCDVDPRPVPGGGSRLSLKKARTQRVAGDAPAPLFLWPARCHSLVLAWWGAAGRSLGYYGAHLRALIWDAFSGRAPQPRGFPLGKH